MADNNQDGIAIFDTIFTNNRICMMKVVLPFLPPSFQKSIAIYIKYLELQYTMQYFAKHSSGIFTGQNEAGSHTPAPDVVWEKLLPYCSPTEKENVKQMRNMMQTFRSMKDMMEMIDTMKELFPDGFGSSGGFDFPDGFGFPGSDEASGGMGGSFPGGFSPELLNQFSTLFNMNATKGD